MSNQRIPNLREATLLALLRDSKMTGEELLENYEDKMDENIPTGSLYTTLERMQDKGYVSSREVKRTGRRGYFGKHF